MDQQPTSKPDTTSLPSMHYENITTNDGTVLAYQTSHPLHPPTSSTSTSTSTSTTLPSSNPPTTPKTCLLLMHGFSGSSSYFKHNIPTLTSPTTLLLAPDMRGHGRSQQTPHGYHIARLSHDLHTLLTHLKTTHPTIHIYGIGCSIGAAVLWTYVELFTDSIFSGLVFVDQAPLQDRSAFGGGWGQGLAHSGCYDEATTRAAQNAWSSPDPAIRDAAHRDLVAGCFGYRFAPLPTDSVSAEQAEADEEFFVNISAVCDGTWLARLLEDHTRYDHREALELVKVPVLVLMGKRSGCFSVEGMMEIVRRVRKGGGTARGVEFESGHWLFWEEPERFKEVLCGFVSDCEGKTRAE